jgi:hypothetical protein
LKSIAASVSIGTLVALTQGRLIDHAEPHPLAAQLLVGAGWVDAIASLAIVWLLAKTRSRGRGRKRALITMAVRMIE